MGENRNSAGIGYICVPEDIDRNKFVNNCFANGSISFITENAERFDNIKVSKSIFQDLDFPENSTLLGSLIIWVILPFYTEPVIVGLINKSNEYLNLSEGQFSISKKELDCLVEVSGDVKKGIININIDSKKKAELNISVHNKDKSSTLNLISDNEINFQSEKTVNLKVGQEFNIEITNPVKDKSKITTIKYILNEGFSYVDEFENQIYFNEKNIQFKPNMIFNIGEGSEPIPLGDTLASLLDEFITQVAAATTTTLMGPMPILNSVAIAKLQLKVDAIKSKLSFTD